MGVLLIIGIPVLCIGYCADTTGVATSEATAVVRAHTYDRGAYRLHVVTDGGQDAKIEVDLNQYADIKDGQRVGIRYRQGRATSHMYDTTLTGRR